MGQSLEFMQQTRWWLLTIINCIHKLSKIVTTFGFRQRICGMFCIKLHHRAMFGKLHNWSIAHISQSLHNKAFILDKRYILPRNTESLSASSITSRSRIMLLWSSDLRMSTSSIGGVESSITFRRLFCRTRLSWLDKVVEVRTLARARGPANRIKSLYCMRRKRDLLNSLIAW